MGLDLKRMEPHSHTHYSNIKLLDSINRPKDLIDRAIKIGLSGICITDHECLSGHMEVNLYAKELKEKYPDFKIGLGNEIYLCPSRENGQKYYHFILIAKNKTGHRALRELSSRAWMSSYYDRGMERTVTLYSDLEEIVRKYPNSLIATSACLGGQLSTQTLNLINAEAMGDTKAATAAHQDIVNFILWCKSLFDNDFYIECAPGCSKDQIAVNKRLVSIAECFDIPMIIGSDAHYLKREDRFVHKAFLNSKGGEREVDEFYEYAYLQDEDDIRNNISQSIPDELDKMISNSHQIWEKIEYYSLEHNQTIPKVEVKDYPKKEYNSEEKMNKYPILKSMFNSDDKIERYWVNQCWEQLKNIAKEKNPVFPETVDVFEDIPEYLDRLEEEADVKRTVGEKLGTNIFAYPVTLQHYVDLFWKCGSIVGAGRGSSCSGLNHYLLGITQLDPIKWDLPFFRYMNKDRTDELPDIDLDLCPSKRPKILKEIKKERGQNFKKDIDGLSKQNLGCTLIATFGTESTKSAILTACFEAGSQVLTIQGKKSIENIQTGDVVWTTNGWESVITPTILKNKEIMSIENRYSTDNVIHCTEDHEFLIIEKDSHRGRITGNFNRKKVLELFPEFSQYKSTDSIYSSVYGYCRDTQPVWKPAKDLQVNSIRQKYYGCRKIDLTIEDKQYLIWNNQFFKKNGIGISEHIKISNELCELIGIYLAEGSCNGSQLTFTINKNEEILKQRIIELMWKVFQLDNVGIYERKDSQALNISYSSRQLIAFFSQLFEVENLKEVTQWNKKLPSVLKYIEPKKQLQIFKGWFVGDGYARGMNKDRSYEAKGTTVSKQLADDMIFILNRNYINPTVTIENRQDRCTSYNVQLYSKKAQKLFNLKYNSNLKEELYFTISDRGEMDFPCFIGEEIYLKTGLYYIDKKTTQTENVYCLKVPSENFTLGDTIVHNCRGYRSADYPDGIDVDTAQYMSSLVPSERGFLWSLKELVNGDPDKDRKPVTTFIKEVNQYPGLLDIMFGIEGLISHRGSHASGVILFDEDPYEYCCFMKTPKGEICTQYDLHMVEKAGCTKYDFLVTDVSDKITEAIKLLQKYNEVDSFLSLREVYNEYFHPSVLPIHENKYWDALAEGSVLNVFQFDSQVGSQAARKIRPRNILELMDANGLMRLMTAEKGQESPMDKYIRFKDNINLWYQEMDREGLTKEEQKILEPYFLPSYGVPPSQEQMMRMVMDPDICGFTLAEANAARKTVGKKVMSKIPELHEKVLQKAKSPALGSYVWKYGMGPQMGYAFNQPHALAYSFIGFQTLFIALNWDPIYWNTACLIVNSGSLEVEDEDSKEKGTNYAKTAKALGEIISKGIKVSLIDINKSNYSFEPDVENHQILFGLKALSGINKSVIDNVILKNRPFVSFIDFMNRCSLTKTQYISLIKAGAFDNLEEDWAKELNVEPRILIMVLYLSRACEPKKRLTLQNFNGLIQKNLIPKSLEDQKQTFLFNKYLKAEKKSGQYYIIGEISEKFFNQQYANDLDKINIINGISCILQDDWDKIYKREMDLARDWLKNNQETVLKEYNELLFLDCWEKYATGSVSAWEMESLCFYYHEHELTNVNTSKYGISNFFSMPTEPEINYFFKRNGKQIPIFKLSKIIGTVIGKNDVRSSVDLLTTQGVVNVKFNKEYYSMYNRQISEKQSDGTKKIKEKGWFTRGSKIMVTGFRRDDTFVTKNYANNSGHMLYKITDVDNQGNMTLVHDRYEVKNEK